MTSEEYKNAITPEFVRRLFEHSILSDETERWAITICGKIISVQGKIFYNSREQAVKAFYNMFSWRIRRELLIATHPNERVYGWWSSQERPIMWKVIKKTLTEEYGLDFIKL